jgi:hypothetical protein
MKAVKTEKIEKQYYAWIDEYSENKKRGETAIDFIIADNQWDGNTVTERRELNQESLTFNLSIKHLRRAHTQMGEIEFTLDLSPTNNKYDDNVDEMAAFRLLLDSIVLNDETRDKFNEAGRKCLNYGYAFAHVSFGYEDYETLNLEPKLIIHKDPSIAFWDKTSLHPTKVDGRFCGLCRTLTEEELVKKYPSLKKANWLHRKENKVFDYWWREYEDMDFITLTTGVQKREDLLTSEDMQMVDKKKEKVKSPVCTIYYQRTCGEKVLEGPIEYPTKNLLPLVYHPGLTEWHPMKGDITIPYCQYMIGTQKLHNYVMSQGATQAKSCNSDKWFFNKEHVTTPTERDNAKNINKRGGGMTFNGDLAKIRREQPAEISQSLLTLAQQTKQEIDEINGAMIDTQNAQQTVIAAKALDKITHNMEAINMWFMNGHITFVNQIGRVYREMIPQLYTQERAIIVKKKDGSGHTITINQDAGTGALINNIKDINNNFKYEITAGPSSTMQKENTVKYLTEVYQINPAMFQATAHIFFRNLQTQDANELSRIAMAMGDQSLIKYSQGEINMEEYQQAKEEEMQKKMQQQQQMASSDPQVQGAQAMAAAEHRKAAAAEFNAQTSRIKAINDAEQKQQELKLQVVELVMNGKIENNKQQLEALNTQIRRNQQYIDALHEDRRMNVDLEKHYSQLESDKNAAASNAEVY